MTAILLVYLAISYGFSGFVCSLAFLRRINDSSVSLTSRLYSTLTCIAIAFFWPLWIVKEIGYDHEESESEFMPSPGVEESSFSLPQPTVCNIKK